MTEFKFIPASKASLSARRLVCGVGINDADYIVNPKVNGKTTLCSFYKTWQSMIKRCYEAKTIARNPSYKGCSVCDDWLTFSIFKDWMVTKSWQGMQLDKDILVTGNKVYSPFTCIFVTLAVNSLVSSRGLNSKGNLRGAHLFKATGKYQAYYGVNGKRKHIGYFETEGEASNAHIKFRSEYISSVAIKQSEPLRSALLRIVNELC